MTNRLDRLEQAGLLDRQPDPGDRRGVLVCLSEAGKGLADVAVEDSIAEQRAVVDVVSVEKRALAASVMQELLVGLGDTADPAPVHGQRAK